jgi:HAD superfamily phosphoserine phosphatase-like hydrolase
MLGLIDTKTVRGAIISILAEEKSLSSIKLYNKIIKKYSLKVSYQAVYKMLQNLIDQKIICFKDKKYFINLIWVENLEIFAHTLKSNLIFSNPTYLPGLKEFRSDIGIQNFVFDSLDSAEKFRKKLQTNFFENNVENEPYIGHSNHLKSPIIYSERSLDTLNLIKKTKTNCYLLVSGNSNLDRWCANYYRNNFVKVKTGCKIADDCELMVLGDVITQLFIPKEIQDFLENAYLSSNKISDISVPELYSFVYGKKVKTKFIVIKNKYLADQIKKQTINNFENIVSLFDLDGTLTKGFILLPFCEYLDQQNKFSKTCLKKIKICLKKYGENKLTYESFAKKIILLYGAGLKDQKEKIINEEAEKFLNSDLIEFFSYSSKIINFAKKFGPINLITGSPKELISILSKKLNFESYFSTELEVVNGIYNGKIIRNLSLKSEKEKIVQDNLVKKNKIIFLSFGDTLSDLPILENAKIPVVFGVNPSLKKLAVEKKWFQILNEKDFNAKFKLLIREVNKKY